MTPQSPLPGTNTTIGVVATLDLVDVVDLVPWMGERPWWLELIGGASGAVVVPLLLGLTWGRFRVAGVVTAIALLTLTGAATVAAALHRAYSICWVGATAAATLLLCLPLSLETRTVVALLCGPLVGITVHLAALAQRR